MFRESLGGPEDMRTVDRGGAPGRAKVMERFANIPVQVKAGTYDVAVTFIERARVESDEFVGFLPGDEFSRGDRMPRLVDGVTVVGPFNSPGVSETPSRRRSSSAARKRERTSARAPGASPRPSRRRAFRRPVTAAKSIADAVLRRGPEGARRLRRGHRAADRRGAGQPRVPVSRDSGPEAGSNDPAPQASAQFR